MWGVMVTDSGAGADALVHLACELPVDNIIMLGKLFDLLAAIAQNNSYTTQTTAYVVYAAL